MYALGIDHGFIVYECKNDQDLAVFHVEMNEEHREFVEAKLQWMRDAYAAFQEGKVPKRGHRRTTRRFARSARSRSLPPTKR